jgi:hypothetical protein
MDNKPEYFKTYYKANKNRIMENAKKHKDKQIFCDVCKKSVKYFSMASHRRTAKHKTQLEKQNDDKITEQKIITVLKKLLEF